MNFLEWKIHHIPEEYISTPNRYYLGSFGENYQAVLVYEEWELRAYSYEYSADREDWLTDCDDVFEDFVGYLDMLSLGYVVVDIEKLDEFLCYCGETFNCFPSCVKDTVRERVKQREKDCHFVKVYAYYK